MNRWMEQKLGLPMTGRRWLLVIQAATAFLLLVRVTTLEVGQRQVWKGELDPNVVVPLTTIFLLTALFASIGIFQKRAWGYLLEVPVLALIFLFVALLIDKPSKGMLFTGDDKIYTIFFVVFFAIPELFKCARTGIRLGREEWAAKRIVRSGTW